MTSHLTLIHTLQASIHTHTNMHSHKHSCTHSHTRTHNCHTTHIYTLLVITTHTHTHMLSTQTHTHIHANPHSPQNKTRGCKHKFDQSTLAQEAPKDATGQSRACTGQTATLAQRRRQRAKAAPPQKGSTTSVQTLARW